MGTLSRTRPPKQLTLFCFCRQVAWQTIPAIGRTITVTITCAPCLGAPESAK